MTIVVKHLDGWKMPMDTEVEPGPGRIVLDGDPAPSAKGHPSELLLISCLMRCTVTSPGKYDWGVHVRRRCSLMSNYFDHLLLLFQSLSAFVFCTVCLHNGLKRSFLCLCVNCGSGVEHCSDSNYHSSAYHNNTDFIRYSPLVPRTTLKSKGEYRDFLLSNIVFSFLFILVI